MLEMLDYFPVYHILSFPSIKVISHKEEMRWINNKNVKDKYNANRTHTGEGQLLNISMKNCALT